MPDGTQRAGARIRAANPADLDDVLALRNDAVAHSTALWTEHQQTREEAQVWLAEHLRRRSALVAEVDGAFAGFAVYGPWKPKDGYRFTVENSVYLWPDLHRSGLGLALMTALIDRAREAGMHVMVAGIESGNLASIRLHERLGFEHAGVVREVGFKFGRWLDLVHMRLPLHSPGADQQTAGR